MERKVCSVCVMDNYGDSTIVFDDNGQCDYCRRAEQWKSKLYFPNAEGKKKLDDMLAEIKAASADQQYDCIIGMSGGLDSSYLAYVAAVKWGLRVLAIHINDGFDEELATQNINSICKACGIELIEIAPDKKQFNDLTLAYFRAGVPNLAVPQDNVLFAALYGYAYDHRIRYVLSGSNFALESIIQRGNTYTAYDLANILDINKRNGNADISKLRFISEKELGRYLHGKGAVHVMAPLNYIDYNREKAINELEKACGFRYYKSKHLENKLTKFLQTYYLYEKFGVDKRKSHLSSMIVSGQMNRTEALNELEKPLYDIEDMSRTIDVICAYWGISRTEFDSVMKQQPHQHNYYKTSKKNMIVNWIRIAVRKWRNNVSNIRIQSKKRDNI